MRQRFYLYGQLVAAIDRGLALLEPLSVLPVCQQEVVEAAAAAFWTGRVCKAVASAGRPVVRRVLLPWTPCVDGVGIGGPAGFGLDVEILAAKEIGA
jgi:hypothetical protein